LAREEARLAREQTNELERLRREEARLARELKERELQEARTANELERRRLEILERQGCRCMIM